MLYTGYNIITIVFGTIFALSLCFIIQQRRETESLISTMEEGKEPNLAQAPTTAPDYHLYHIQNLVSLNSMGYKGIPKHDVNNRYCINPPPFGDQCTVLSEHALAACVKEEDCKVRASEKTSVMSRISNSARRRRAMFAQIPTPIYQTGAMPDLRESLAQYVSYETRQPSRQMKSITECASPTVALHSLSA
jgi:hypothetical protein